MANLFQLLIIGCVILVIIGVILAFTPDPDKRIGYLPTGLFLAGIIGGFAIYLCKKYNIVNFD